VHSLIWERLLAPLRLEREGLPKPDRLSNA